MLYNLYFLKNYSNYYNRELKWEATLSDYLAKYPTANYSQQRCNLNINDGVNTEVIVNGNPGFEWTGTYIIAMDSNTAEIHSRWFVIEAIWVRDGQYRLTLRRDLVADFLEPLLHSTVYVEKGTLTENIISINEMNYLAFNQEAFTANQIKTSETLLKDTLGCKWLVGYVNKHSWETDTSVEAIKNLAFVPSAVITNKSDLALDRNEYLHYAVDVTTQFDYKVTDINYPDATPLYKRRLNLSNEDSYFTELRTDPRGKIITPAVRNTYPTLLNFGYSTLLNYAKNTLNASKRITQETWEQILNLDGKIVRVSSEDKYYRIAIDRIGGSSNRYDINPNTNPTCYDEMKNYALANDFVILEDTPENFRMDVYWSEGIKATLIEVNQGDYKVNIKATRNRTIGEAFDAFAIPYVEGEPIYIHLENLFLGKVNDTTAAISIAQEMLDVNSEVLDLQLLPYCPLPDSMISYYQAEGDPKPYPIITVSQADVPYQAAQITNINEDKVFNVVFWLDNTQFSKIIPYTDTNNYKNLEEVKCINQLDTWRISSGDYSSSFEFNMARNGGVRHFEIDCAYKPYQPYIHIAPNFGRLYGDDYNDTRGLVCSNTNYSLPRLNDAWESYERNNLNYMNSFNRQIQNMDIQRKYQKTAEIASAIAGGIGAGASGIAAGAIAGSAVAPGIGTIVGGVAGGVLGGGASAAGAVYDIYASNQIYKENKQHAIDQFNMSLQNIQAMPNTLAAVGALNPNNKVFPVLSYYTCSDVEREAFKQKMKWNGITIGALTDDISKYISLDKKTYFKGQLVYFPNEEVAIDAHELSELANELAKGIIFDKGVIH